MVAGLLGGTPCTGVLVRTAVNVNSGATDKASQLINSLVVLLVVLVIMPIFVYTPMCCIAAILITSAVRLVPFGLFQKMWVQDRFELAVLFVTASVCVFVDGAFGLMVGAVISIMRTAVKSQTSDVSEIFDKTSFTVIKVRGQISYITAEHVEDALIQDIKDNHGKDLVLDLEGVPFIDLDGIQALKTVFGRAQKTTTMMLRINGHLYPSLLKSAFFAGLNEQKLVVDYSVKDSEMPDRIREAKSLMELA
jgi:SulP family sulfate permease